MQRVVWINKSNWRKPGPIVYMGLLNALAFAENGLATDFFVGSDKDSDTEADLTDFYGLQTHQYLNIHRIPDTAGWQRSVYKEAIAKIALYCGKGDEVLALTRELGVLALLLKLRKKFPKLKVIYEAHDYYLSIRHLKKKRFSLSSIRRQWSERILIPKADGLICLTEHQRALYQQWFPKLAIIALSLGCLDFPLQPLVEQRRLKRRIAYIGHLHSYKGLELIFELAGYLKTANIELHSFGGNETQVLALQERADKEGLTGALHFRPFIEPRVLHEILDNDISIGLVPLQDTFYSRYLTCPVKALDFIAHGLPTIASEIPSVREVLRETGFYCDSKKVSEFADNTIALLDDADAYLLATKASYSRSHELQWRLRAKRILEFVEGMCIAILGFFEHDLFVVAEIEFWL
ncbi:MAG: glycosyltransferase [Methylococcales bacterium]|nr:glycosyltransferase [Methylococcales bacterium]